MTPKIYPDSYTVADIIADVIWTDEGTIRGTVTEAAQALKDSGRLMPRPADHQNREGYWWPKAATLGNVSRTPRGEIRIQSGNFQQFQMYLTPEKALDLAAILTAAATEEV